MNYTIHKLNAPSNLFAHEKKNPQQFDTLIGSGIFQNLSKYYNQQYTNKLSV